MKLVFASVILILIACEKKEAIPATNIIFEGTQKVTVTGYTDHLMEPFLSRDGNTLMFNNSNEAINTNLHWATRVNDSTFEYKGEMTGINTTSLEGVPSMDRNGTLYFVSNRDYDQTLATIFKSNFSNGVVTNITHVDGISKNKGGWVNFDVEINPDGETLYFVDGRFDQSGGPYEADIVIAQGTNGNFQRLPNSDEILKNINTDALEYAACISASSLELYFSRVEGPLTAASMPQIFVSSRSNTKEPFGMPTKILSITGFVEAATISSDGYKLYYHKKVDGKFGLYLTKRAK